MVRDPEGSQKNRFWGRVAKEQNHIKSKTKNIGQVFKKKRQKLNNKDKEKVVFLCSTRPRGTRDSFLHSQSPKEIREVHKNKSEFMF